MLHIYQAQIAYMEGLGMMEEEGAVEVEEEGVVKGEVAAVVQSVLCYSGGLDGF